MHEKNDKKSSFCIIILCDAVRVLIGAAGCADRNMDSFSTETSVKDWVGGSSNLDGISTHDDSSELGGDTTPDDPETPESATLSILLPESEVFPYVDAAKNFLQAGEGVDVADYAGGGMKNAQAPVQVKWKYKGEGTKKFIILLAYGQPKIARLTAPFISRFVRKTYRLVA